MTQSRSSSPLPVSLWSNRAQRPPYQDVELGTSYDLVVVGAGLTGLTSALLAVRAGESVAVVEARGVGSVTTGNTTAKLSLLQGSKLSSIAARNPRSAVRRYVEANRAGQQWLLDYCASRGVAVQRETAYTYTTSLSAMSTIRAELSLAADAGLPVQFTRETDLPYAVAGAVALPDQAQFDPMDVLDALVGDIRAGGGHVTERVRVRSASVSHGAVRLRTDHGTVRGRRVILATGTPVLDRGLFFSRLEPLRSYCVAFETANPVPRGMYLSVDSPSRSLRWAPTADGDRLIVGGNGHTVGREASPAAQYADLVDWTEQHFAGARETHRWSAQDYESVEVLPYAGSLLPGEKRISIASGYDKWGMTNGVAAALHLDAESRGERFAWSDTFTTWNPRVLRGATSAVRTNGAVGAWLAGGWVSSFLRSGSTTAPLEGQGRVERSAVPRAVSTVDGTTRSMPALCTHLGGILNWNDAERSWDCPLHGSRFAPDGSVLEGPATRDIPCRVARGSDGP